MTTSPPTPTHYTARLAAALASEHLPLHGPFVIHLCRRITAALIDTDPAALARLIECVEALRESMGELPGLEAPAGGRWTAPPDPDRLAALRHERFGK